MRQLIVITCIFVIVSSAATVFQVWQDNSHYLYEIMAQWEADDIKVEQARKEEENAKRLVEMEKTIKAERKDCLEAAAQRYKRPSQALIEKVEACIASRKITQIEADIFAVDQ